MNRIDQHIRRVIADYKNAVRLAVHVVAELTKINKAQIEHFQENGRYMTDDELVEITGVSKKTISSINSVTHATSMDSKIGDEGTDVVGDFVKDLQRGIEDDVGTKMQVEALMVTM